MDCKKCGLHKNRKNIVHGFGAESPEYLFVEEAPGEEEDRKGVPFIGKAGQRLRWILRYSGISQVRITNIVRCNPRITYKSGHSIRYKNRPPTITEIQTCLSHFDAEIEKYPPKVIVTVGKVPTATLMGLDYNSVKAGDLYNKKFFYKGIPCVGTYHPSYILRGHLEATEIVLDTIHYATLIKNGQDKDIDTYILKPEDSEMALKVIRHLKTVDWFSADLENAPQKLDWKILGIALSWKEDKGIYLPLRDSGGMAGRLFDYWGDRQSEIIRELIELISGKYQDIVWHNAQWDTSRLWDEWKIPPAICDDTMIMSGALFDTNMDGTFFRRSLAKLGYKFLPYLAGWKEEIKDTFNKKSEVDFTKIPINKLGVYAAEDAIITYKLKKLFIKRFMRN